VGNAHHRTYQEPAGIARPAIPKFLCNGHRPCGSVCYSRQLASIADINMIETNPILAQIADIRGRVESLRGYL
jgi:hypothetical protein